MSTPAGWYPQADGRQRYWDGERWTEHFAPGAPAGANPTGPAGQQFGADAARGSGVDRPWFKKKRFIIPAGFAAFVVMVSALTGGGEEPVEASPAETPSVTATSGATPAAAKPASTPAAKPAAKPAPKVAGVGSKVRDGKFEFTVKSVKCGIAKVGTNEYLEKKAQGQFCAIALAVVNIGDEPQMMFADNQYAFDSKNRKLGADSEASIYDEKSQVLWEEINPGNSVSGVVYFDLPKAEKITKLELHDSAFSGGVDVAVS